MELHAGRRHTSLDLAKQLVATVARAFYTDDVVILLDALTRETFIYYEEIPLRLHMSSKDINRMLSELEDKEGLIKSQNLTIEYVSRKCYYIDYQSFVNIVRYRVHMMREELKKKEAELNSMNFQCLNCGYKCSALEAMKLLTKDMKRACPVCCPSSNFSATIVSERYVLVEVTVQSTNSNILSTIDKFKEQLSVSDDHVGILDLLQELKDVPLLRNLPSDNYERGLVSKRVVDEETRLDIEEASRKKVDAVKKGAAIGMGGFGGKDDGGLRVEIVGGMNASSTSSSERPTKMMRSEPAISSADGTVTSSKAADDDEDVDWE